MKACLFCGGADLTKEHIIPQWLLHQIGIYDKSVSMSHASFVMPYSNRQHVFNKLVNSSVCYTCNTGWMSKLEGHVKEHLINLIKPNMNRAKDTMEFISNNSSIFAQWAFKTAILLNYPTNYRNIVPEEHFKIVYKGEFPEGTFIDIGITNNSDKINWRQSQGVLMIKDKFEDITKVVEDLNKQYKITYQFKSLLIRVCYLPYSYDTICQETEGVISIHPLFGLYKDIKIFNDIDDFDLSHYFIKVRK